MSDAEKIRFTQVIQDLPVSVPFVGPEAQERNTGIEFKARVGANESGFGPSPKVIDAMVAAASETWKYSDPENHHSSRNAIAEFYNISPKNVVVGEGIDGLLGCTAQLFVEPGVHVITSLGSYPTFNFHINGRGGKLHLVPYKDDHEDLDTLLAQGSGNRSFSLVCVQSEQSLWVHGGAVTRWRSFIGKLPIRYGIGA